MIAALSISTRVVQGGVLKKAARRLFRVALPPPAIVAIPDAFWHRWRAQRPPSRWFFGCGCSSGVEHDLAKVGVEGSNPFARSIFFSNIKDLVSRRQGAALTRIGGSGEGVGRHQDGVGGAEGTADD